MYKPRLVVFTSHPIQYQTPLFRALARRPELDLKVYFYSRLGIEKQVDPQFGVPFSWDTPLLEGYEHCFLKNYGLDPGPRRFLSLLNPGALPIALSSSADVIWMQGWALATNWLVWLSSFVAGKPLLIRGESNGFDEPKGVKAYIKRAVLRTLFSRVRGFLSIGHLNEQFYRSYGILEEQIFSVPYAVDNDVFVQQSESLRSQKRALRRSYGIADDLPVVLFTGKLIAKKRVIDLIEAFADAQKHTPCSLALVGDGELRRSLEGHVAERSIPRVHFLGFRNQSEIGKLYALADLFVLPSSSEPWGLSVNEALCFGLPVIVSDRVGSGSDLVKPEVNGYIYPCGDCAALSKYIQQTIRSQERLRAMGAESRAIIERWNISRSADGIVRAVLAAYAATRQTARQMKAA